MWLLLNLLPILVLKCIYIIILNKIKPNQNYNFQMKWYIINSLIGKIFWWLWIWLCATSRFSWRITIFQVTFGARCAVLESKKRFLQITLWFILYFVLFSKYPAKKTILKVLNLVDAVILIIFESQLRFFMNTLAPKFFIEKLKLSRTKNNVFIGGEQGWS